MRKQIAAILVLLSAFNFAQILDCPLEEGKISTSKFNPLTVQEMSTTIVSEKSGFVRSFLKGNVFDILKDEISRTYIVIIKDFDNYISFNSLNSTSVHKFDQINEGDIIGEIVSIKGKYTLDIMKFKKTEMVAFPFRFELKCKISDDYLGYRKLQN